MAAEGTDGLILRMVEFSETSLILTLLTRDFGRISAIAKGARRPKSPFEGSLDLLAICRMMLIRKQTSGLNILTESKLEKRFRAGERSLVRLQAGYYMAELLRELTDEGDPQPGLFDIALQAHAAFHTEQDLAQSLTILESRALVVCGHFPSLDQCCGCARPVEPIRQHHFSLSAGGIVCPNCRPNHGNTLILSDSARSAWIGCTRAPTRDWSSELAGELRGISLRWLNHLLGHRLKTQDDLYPS